MNIREDVTQQRGAKARRIERYEQELGLIHTHCKSIGIEINEESNAERVKKEQNREKVQEECVLGNTKKAHSEKERELTQGQRETLTSNRIAACICKNIYLTRNRFDQ